MSEREGDRNLGDWNAERGQCAGAVQSEDPAERWMRRDDEFLLEEDREYVLREEGRSWRDWVSPVAFGVLLAVLVGDAITTGVGMAMGAPRNPVVGPLVAEVGLRGLVLLKATAAVLLVLLPGVTDSLGRAFRAGCATLVFVGSVAVAANAWAVLAVA